MYFDTGGVFFWDETVFLNQRKRPETNSRHSPTNRGSPKCSSFSISSGRSPAKIILKRWASGRPSNDRGSSSYSCVVFAAQALGAYRTCCATGPGDDFVCGPIKGIAMARRRNAEDINDLRIRAQAYRPMTISEKRDRAVRRVVLKTRQLKVPVNVRPLGEADPGPAGFNWVEIDFKQTH